MKIEKLASAIYNDVVSGLSGITSTPNISLEQLQDDIIDEYLQIIKEYSLKDLIPKRDLLYSINCIDIDCKSLDRCCNTSNYSKPQNHFEIPQLVNDFGDSAIDFIGSVDRNIQFKHYTTIAYKHHSIKLRGGNKPYVFIDTSPNENNMYDGFLFNAPLLKKLSIVGIFKDLRQLENYSCCNDELNNMTFIDAEIKKRLTEKKLRYYRQFIQPPTQNNQNPK